MGADLAIKLALALIEQAARISTEVREAHADGREVDLKVCQQRDDVAAAEQALAIAQAT